MSGWWKRRELPQPKPDGFASSLWEGASGAPGHFALQPGGGDDWECAPLRGESFCMPSACKDAPLGQRQGGVFRLPPPYLWTPPTPQRAKGCSPLTILKKKSKHKKASAAPVGAIALTLFSLLHPWPLSRCATAPPRGSLWALPQSFPPPLKPSPTGGRWRIAPDEGQHPLALLRPLSHLR